MQINQTEWDAMRRDRKKLQAIADAPLCEHGKFHGHWPRKKCHCRKNSKGELGNTSTSWLEPNVLKWTSCWHEPWCEGAPELRVLLDALTEDTDD